MAQLKNKKTMEERLKYIETGGNNVEFPEGSNLAELLLKSLKNKDQPTVEAVICIEEQLIIRAVQRLRKDVIQELVKELTVIIQEKRCLFRSGSLWLKHLLQQNSSILMSNKADLAPLKDVIQQRIAFQESLKGLQCKIKYLLNQMDNKTSDMAISDEILETYEEDQSDSDGLEMYESPNEAEDGVNEESDEELSA